MKKKQIPINYLTLLFIVMAFGCSPNAPLFDGMHFAYDFSAENKKTTLDVEFTASGDKWQVTSRTETDGETPTVGLLNKDLTDVESGRVFGLFEFPFWLPPKKRVAGARYKDLSVESQSTWKGWDAWYTRMGPANGYYDLSTGFLVGISVPRLGNLTIVLRESSFPGLRAAQD